MGSGGLGVMGAASCRGWRSVSSLRTSRRLSRVDNRPCSACRASVVTAGCGRCLSYGCEFFAPHSRHPVSPPPARHVIAPIDSAPQHGRKRCGVRRAAGGARETGADRRPPRWFRLMRRTSQRGRACHAMLTYARRPLRLREGRLGRAARRSKPPRNQATHYDWTSSASAWTRPVTLPRGLACRTPLGLGIWPARRARRCRRRWPCRPGGSSGGLPTPEPPSPGNL